MLRFTRSRTLPALAAGLIAVAVPAAATAAVAGGASNHENEFRQTNLISNRTDQGAQVADPNLQNPWGLAMGPATPLWVADNNAGVATIYTINPGGTMAQKVPAMVTLPGGRVSTMDGPSPTGQVFNPTDDFVVKSKVGKGPALFIFSAEAGQISAWSPVADPFMSGNATAQVEFSSKTAVYKGLAIATTEDHTYLYASNFHDGTVDVFNSKFHKVHLEGDFQDPGIPMGFAPFGIQAIRGFIYVTYAKQNAAKHDDVAGLGNGFIDIYTKEGFLVKRLVSMGDLNSPWGLTLAPDGFGAFSDKLLVGNFGDGLIHAYGAFSGKPGGALLNEQGQPIQIDDLWGLRFGTDTTGGEHTLLFSAGINDEKDGLVGSINHVR
ncbi:MAG TPA: TIGR03118 family protein [Streptosporangiaceae bacterium]|nr:TIGR03118 family protein [Streptosporangiaceae bacterium]